MMKISIRIDSVVFFSLLVACCLIFPQGVVAADMPNAKGMLLTPQSFSTESSPVLKSEKKPVRVENPVENATPENLEVSCLMVKNHCQSICTNRFAGVKDNAEFFKDSAHQMKLFEKRRCMSACGKEMDSCLRKSN